MMRNVYLQGELGERFGFKHTMSAEYPQEVVKCIYANHPEFKEYLLDCKEKDIGFSFEFQGKLQNDGELLTPLKEGDITIAVIPAGSKKAIGKIMAAVFLAFVVLPMIGAAASANMTAAQLSTITAESAFGVAMQAGMMTGAGQMVGMLALNLAIAGISQMLAPDPSVDSDAPQNYTFNGQTQAIKAGDPVPLLYGECRVPGRPISVDVKNGNYVNQTSWLDQNGELTPISDDQWQDVNIGAS